MQKTSCSIVHIVATRGKSYKSNPSTPFPSLPCAPRRAAVGSGVALAAHVAFSEGARRQVNESTVG